MKSSERRKLILYYLEKNHIGYTIDLAEELNVSPITIHRDFSAMASKGLLTIIRGGAVLNRGTSVLYSLNFRQDQFPLEKKRIAEYCANLVSDGMTVFIDCGSTAEKIAELLRSKRNVTFMTNSLDTAHILSSSENNTLIMTPGIFSEKLRGFAGQMTTDFMSRFNVDIIFLGAQGIDIGGGLSSPYHIDTETKRILIKHAKKIVVASDHSKFGKIFFETIAMLNEIDLIVTDTGIQSDILKAIENHSANIIAV